MSERDLARSAVERLSEDEALRGDLSDSGYGPLFDWAVKAVTVYATSAADETVVDNYTSGIRKVVETAVAMAEAGKIDAPEELLAFEASSKADLANQLATLPMGDDPDENAIQIAAVLQKGLDISSNNRVEPATVQPASPQAAPVEVPVDKKKDQNSQPPVGNPASQIEEAVTPNPSTLAVEINEPAISSEANNPTIESGNPASPTNSLFGKISNLFRKRFRS